MPEHVWSIICEKAGAGPRLDLHGVFEAWFFEHYPVTVNFFLVSKWLIETYDKLQYRMLLFNRQTGMPIQIAGERRPPVVSRSVYEAQLPWPRGLMIHQEFSDVVLPSPGGYQAVVSVWNAKADGSHSVWLNAFLIEHDQAVANPE